MLCCQSLLNIPECPVHRRQSVYGENREASIISLPIGNFKRGDNYGLMAVFLSDFARSQDS